MKKSFKSRISTDSQEYPSDKSSYKIIRLIGNGTFGKVYEALITKGPRQNEKVAIKSIDLDSYGTDWEIIEKEVKTLHVLNHPNLIRSLCSFLVESELWIVMRYMEGGSCGDILHREFPLGFDDEELIASILSRVIKGLQYLHSDGRIHRDVKATNILISSKGEVLLGDLGVASCLINSGQKKGLTKTFTGTPCWMAPEVMDQEKGYDYKADIWSLGITALELAFGQPPYAKKEPMKILILTLESDPPNIHLYGKRAEKMSRSFKSFVELCLKKDPVRRASAKDLLKHKFFRKTRDENFIRNFFLGRKKSEVKEPKLMEDSVRGGKGERKEKKAISIGNFKFEDTEEQTERRKKQKAGRFDVEVE